MIKHWKDIACAGYGSDPYYKPGHDIWLLLPEGVVPVRVKAKWYWIPELGQVLRSKVFHGARRNSGCGTDPALTDPVLRAIGEAIEGYGFVACYETFEYEGVHIPYHYFYADSEGCEKYAAVYKGFE